MLDLSNLRVHRKRKIVETHAAQLSEGRLETGQSVKGHVRPNEVILGQNRQAVSILTGSTDRSNQQESRAWAARC